MKADMAEILENTEPNLTNQGAPLASLHALFYLHSHGGRPLFVPGEEDKIFFPYKDCLSSLDKKNFFFPHLQCFSHWEK